MKNLLFFVLLVLTVTSVTGQNLVPNPSFEDIPAPTTRWSGTHFAFHRNINLWTSPTGGSPDVLFVEYLGQMFPKRPKVDLSPYQPRTGDYMIGIKTYGCATNTLHCKEYLQVKLVQPIREGRNYYYEYWVYPIEPSVKSNGFGIGLSHSQQEDIMQPGLIDLDPVAIDTTFFDGVAGGWQRVSGTFRANADYNYLILGSFLSDEDLMIAYPIDGIDYGYYLVDDVLVRPVDPEPTPAFTTNETLVLENILFDFDEATIQDSAYEQLHQLAAYLATHPGYTLQIWGHTDSDGSDVYNLELSQQRAEAIEGYLIEQGIAKERIQAVGMGRSFPLVDNADTENRHLNRRVEIRILE
jgi:OOP family OmpA-OmpF porin